MHNFYNILIVVNVEGVRLFTDLVATTIGEDSSSFQKSKGNVIIVTNVASKRGATESSYTVMAKLAVNTAKDDMTHYVPIKSSYITIGVYTQKWTSTK